MKKQILKAFVTIFCVAFATSAFAVVTITSAGSSIGGGSYKPSTNVTVKATASATDYAATSQHASSTPSNGGKQYGTTSNDATIKSAAAITTGPDAPTGGGAAASVLPSPTGGWQ